MVTSINNFQSNIKLNIINIFEKITEYLCETSKNDTSNYSMFMFKSINTKAQLSPWDYLLPHLNEFRIKHNSLVLKESTGEVNVKSSMTLKRLFVVQIRIYFSDVEHIKRLCVIHCNNDKIILTKEHLLDIDSHLRMGINPKIKFEKIFVLTL